MHRLGHVACRQARRYCRGVAAIPFIRLCARRGRAPHSSALIAIAANTRRVRAAQDNEMRLVFYGYVDRQPRSATAVIDGTRLSNVIDLSFLYAGGEISPDGKRIAFDTCAKTDRAINVARLDGSDVKRVVPVSGANCVAVRWS